MISVGRGERLEKSKDSFIFSRRDLKREAKTNLKHHYMMYVVACLFSLIIQAEFFTSDNLISVRRQVVSDAVDAVCELTGQDDHVRRIEDAYMSIDADADSFYKDVKQFLYSKTLENDDANKVFGRTRGMLNQIINYITEETIVSNLYSVVIQFIAFGNVGKLLLIILLAIVAAFAWLFVRNVYIAVNRRIFLEGRIYKRIPFSKYLFFIRMKRWIRASFTMAFRTLIELVGMSTIVGFPVVHFGFFLMPYIIAENPDIKPLQAAKLSWLMMRGNKWKLFLMSMSFMGWYVLGSFTFGLTNIFFSNPYMICCYSEYYAKIRKHAKEKGIPGTELLNDEYLFVRADSNTLADTYSDVLAEIAKPEYSLENLEGRREKFFAKYFGVILWNSKEEIEYENRQAHRMRMLAYEKEGQEVAQWLSRLGFNAYVLAYRVPNNRLGALQDIQRAIRLVRRTGATQVGVIGFSAGASLSCRACTRWNEPAYEAMPKDKADSLSCRPDFGILIYPAYLDEGENHTLTPELTVTKDTPPLFVFGTEDDVHYSGPSTPVILEAMQKAGAPIEVHYLTRGGHGYGMRSGAGLIWPKLAEKWLQGL